MALVSFGYRVDMFAIDPPLEVGAYIVAYDLDGVLKQKDHLGVVTLVGSGAGGPQGPPGPVGPAGLTWSGAWLATQSYPLNYAVGYGSASWWCISPITGSPSNPGPDVDTTHWALLAAQGSPGSQGGTGSQGLQGSQGPIGINWIGDWIINVYDVRDAVYYNGSSYVCIASTVGTETLSPDTNTACWDIISLRGDVGPQGATGSPGVSGATGSTLQDIFYNIGGTVSATNSTSAIYRTGSLNIGTGTASNSRFVVSSSGGTNSLVVDESGNIYNGDLTSLKLGYNSLPNLNKYVANLSYFYDIDNGSGYTDGTYSVTTSLYSGIPLTEYPVIVVDVSGGSVYIQEVLSIGSGWVDDGYSTILTATIPGGSNYQVQIIIYLTDTTNQYNTAIGNNSLYSNTTGAYNTAIGNNSLYSNVDGVYNTALGVQSLYSNTTGISNIALGVQSLYSNTSGYYNTAIGYLSLYSNTIGTYNTAIGSNSLEKNTTTISTLNIIYGGSGYTASSTFSSIQLSYISGSTATTYPIVTVYVGTGGTVSTVTLVTNGTGFKDTTTVMGANLGTGVTFSVGISSLSSGNNNTAIGNNSLYSNTSGAYNTAIGNYSLYSNTTGDNNVALGHQSLYLNKTGFANTALGINSLYSNTSGHNNIAIGLNVLSNNLIGNNNVGIGNNILVFNTTGIFNTAIGNNALVKNITGSYNIALGYQSGNIISGTGDINTGTGATNSNSSIFIGYFTCPSAASNTNEIVIGHGATGNGSNTVTLGNNFVTRTYLKGSVVIADGTQGSGKVLVSDSNGVASWIASTSVASYWTATGSNIINSNNSTVIVSGPTASGEIAIKSPDFIGAAELTGFGIYNSGTVAGTYFYGSWFNSAPGYGLQDFTAQTKFYIDATTYNWVSSKPISIGTGTASDSRLLVSSSGGTTSFYVNEAGDSVFRGDTKIIGATFSPNLPPGSITFGSKTAIYSPGSAEIVIGTDTSIGYNYQNGWKFNGYQITNLWGNAIEFQNSMGTIGNLWIGSNYTFAGFNPFVNTQQCTLFVKGTTASIMRVVGTGATWSNSQSIFEINNSGVVSIGTSLSMSDSKLFIQSSTSSTTIGSSVMLDLYNGDTTTFDSLSEIAFSQNGQPGASQPYNVGHRYALISGYAITGNNSFSCGGIKFSTRATNGSSLVTSLVVDQNGSVYNDARGSNTLYGYNALLVSTGINNVAIGTSALQNNLGGLNNTAVGLSSMASNTSGNYNTAVGSQALVLNVLGNDNVAIGISSQYSATQSSGNTSVGRESLYNNLSSGLVAIGAYTLTNNTLGVSNTAIGYQSLLSNTTVVSTINISNGGSGYTMSSTFSNVQLSYISGSTATTYPIVTVYVGTGGTVSTVTLVTNGSGFKDTTTVMGANLGTGVTFSVSVSSLNSGDYNTGVGYRSLYSNTTGDNNTALGYQSLYSNTTGFNNTTLGFQSLRNNTTGTNSVAIGYQALYNNTTGHDNVAIGYRALYFNEEDNFARPGRFNVAIGSSALYINESGKYNVAIGHQALYSNEVDNNVALGYQSLYTNYSGDNNTAVGSQALYSSYNGYQNTAIGRISLWSNTTGSGNTAVGHQALYNNTTGGQNVGLGVGTLNANTTGTYNTALGYAALQANISGSYNIAIGNQAGYFNSLFQLATSSNNSIFIGYDTKPQLSNQTNQVVIGHGATGNGSNSFTLGNDSITKTIVKGNVGIGLTGPSTKLHIYATQSGALRLEDGTQGSGKVLVSDSNGVATWTPLSSIGISGSASYIPKFTGTSSLGNSSFVDNGSSGYYSVGSDSVTFLAGANVSLRLLRAQSSMDFTLGNPGVPQSGIITSYNTYGLDIVSQGYLALSSGPSFSEAMRISSNRYIGIGLTGPSTKLHIYATQSGALRLEDGTQANGYILTSDTNGVATWTASFALGVIATSSNITTDTLDINGLSQRGRCIIIDNGTYSINLTVNGATGFSSTYLKHGTASVTFVQGSGRTLVQVDGTAVLNGVAGSTATLLSYGTTDYLRINNA
jgi:hypothetical protein